MNKLKILIFFLFATPFLLQGQVGDPGQSARAELRKRGLNEDEVKRRLEEKGIDVYNLNPADVTAMLKAERALEEVLDDLEAEKVRTMPNPNASESIDTIKDDQKKILAKNSEEVSEAVEDGASLEEAVSETLTDDQTNALPKAKIYGQEVFRSQSIKLYRQSKDVKAPDNYVLGVGDVIGLSIWGASEASQIYEINEDGYIKPTGIPRIYLKGISYREARKLLQNRFQNYYSFNANQFEISLNFARTINVSIVGDVFNFGSFNIPAINTAFNALVAAGGPNDIGSVRKIQLIRAGQAPITIDIYEYLLNPQIAANYYLEENDVLFVPVAQKLVDISGAVKKPFIYELLNNEDLSALITYAGGLKANALTKNLQVIRYENDEEVIIDVNWSDLLASNTDFKLQNGDRVTIKNIPSNYDNFVTIDGAVNVAGNYQFQQGDKIADLIDKLELEDGAFLPLSYVRRLNKDSSISYIKINLENAIADASSLDNLVLQKKDNITILTQSYFVDESTFTVRGAVRNESTYTYDNENTIKVSDALFLSGGLRTDAADFAYIKREDRDNPKQNQYIKIDLSSISADNNSVANIYLEPRDVLTVYSNREFTDELFINVDGFVRNPGLFLYDESLSLTDVLTMSGGLRYEAARNRIDIYRVDIDDDNQTKIVAANIKVDEDLNVIGQNIVLFPFDQIVVRRAAEFELQQNIIISGDVKYPGKYALIKENERLSEVLKRAGGLTKEASAEGITIDRSGNYLIVADYLSAIERPGSADDIILRAGDNIVIPRQQNLVFIEGATAASSLYSKLNETSKKISAPYEKGKNALYYLEKYAGGVSAIGSKNEISVREQNGKVDDVNRFLWIRSYPEVGKGATIFVGVKPEKKNIFKTAGKTDWGQVVSTSIAQAVSVLTLILLVQRLD